MTSHIKPISKILREKLRSGYLDIPTYEKLLNQAIREVRG